MHDTEFPASKSVSRFIVKLAISQAKRKRQPNSSCSLLIVLAFALLVCSCVKVPRQAGTTTVVTSSASFIGTRPEATRLNINTASARELEALPGIGKVMAERILAHRGQYGPFRRAEHLMMVRGLSDHKFRAIRERVAVE
jgi:competence ComEA-like helix-hairpin-helix protein